jgi:hypothetical protein
VTVIAAAIVPLALVAGWFLWTRLPPSETGDETDHVDTFFAVTLAGVLVTGLIALLLAEIGVLRPLPLAVLLCAFIAALAPLRRRSASSRPRAAHGVAALLVAAGTACTLAPASEEVLGGRDGGVYANTAIWLAQHGTLQVHSEALAETTREWQRIFRATALLPGFYITDAARGALAPQFLHFHPLLMAVGYWIAGPRGMFLVPPLLGVLAVMAVFLFVRRTLGAMPAALAAAVLGLNLAQIWSARNPYSEPATQVGIFAALWCLAAGHATGGVRWGVLGGLALGSCFLVRIDAPLLLVALAPTLVALHAMGRGGRRWIPTAFLPVTAALAVWGGAHAWVYSRPYVTDLTRFVRPLWMLTAVLVLACVAGLAARRHVHALIERVHRWGPRAWLPAAAAIILAFAWGMWVRPHLEPFVVRLNGERSYVEETLVRVGWYFSATGMIAALAGIVVLLRRAISARRVEWLPFLALTLAFSSVYFWNQRIYPDHPWMMRRYLPVVVPAIAVAIAAAVHFLWTISGRWRAAARLAALGTVGVVLTHEALMLAPFWTLREKDGLVAQIAAIAGAIPERSLVLFTRPGPDAGVATPLAMEWGHRVLPVIRVAWDPDGERRRGRFEAQILRWLAAGREVHYLTADEGDAVFLTRAIRWEEAGTFPIDVPTFGVHHNSPPRAPQRFAVTERLLRAVSAIDDARPCSGAAVHAGGRLGNAMQGLHALESTGREQFHWATPDARVMFPRCVRAGPLGLRFRAACGREPGPEGCGVSIAVNGTPAATVPLRREFLDFDVPIPDAAIADGAGAIEVRFRGHPFAEHGPGRSGRTLSFQFAGVTLQDGRRVDATSRPSLSTSHGRLH